MIDQASIAVLRAEWERIRSRPYEVDAREKLIERLLAALESQVPCPVCVNAGRGVVIHGAALEAGPSEPRICEHMRRMNICCAGCWRMFGGRGHSCGECNLMVSWLVHREAGPSLANYDESAVARAALAGITLTQRELAKQWRWCQCQGTDTIAHVHYEESPNRCARCSCNGFVGWPRPGYDKL